METMTSKKAKNNDLIHKTDFTKFKPKDVSKKKNQNSKRVDTFLPVSNEDTHKTQLKSWGFPFFWINHYVPQRQKDRRSQNRVYALIPSFPTFELLFLLVEDTTTNQQRIPNADAKTHSPANNAGRRSSRAGFPSSSNLKIIQ
jgi:hypothetical protein